MAKKKPIRLDVLIKKLGGGGCLGILIGGAAATVGTVWGGYELGSAINDAINNTSIIGRGALDLLVMGSIAGPAYPIGILGGAIVGVTTGAAVGYAAETYKNWRKKEGPKDK